MPQSLAPIPASVPIVDRTGAITIFFRQRWQQLQNAFLFTPTVSAVTLLAQTAALATTSAYVTLSAGRYRISYYLRRTANDGTSSSATFTYGWTDHGTPYTESETAMTEAGPATPQQSGSKLVFSDGATAITYAVAYASNTAHKMAFALDVTVEQLA